MAYIINRGTKAHPKWYAKYRDIDGKWKQKATHQPTLKEAQRFVAELVGRIARGQIGIPEVSPEEHKRQTITVAELAHRFVAEYASPRLRNRARYMEQVRSVFKHRLLPHPIAAMAAAEVRKKDGASLREALIRDGYRPATVNQALAHVSRLFTWAAEQELIDCKNPFASIDYLRTKPSRECYTREQVEHLLDPEHLHPPIAVALYTGMRRGEIAALTWDCVRFDLSRIEIRHSFSGPTKSDKVRQIPIHRELVPILQAWQARCPASPQGLVFPLAVGRQWRMQTPRSLAHVREALEAAGCPADLERPWHAMRRTFATLFIESGGSRDALERILGHTTSGNRITSVYILPSLEHAAREMAKLSLLPRQSAKVYTLDTYRQRTA